MSTLKTCIIYPGYTLSQNPMQFANEALLPGCESQLNTTKIVDIRINLLHLCQKINGKKYIKFPRGL